MTSNAKELQQSSTDSSTPSDSTFAQFAIDPRIIKNVAKLGFTTATPIQARAIPPLMDRRDLVGRARTGSGKTAAFGLALADLILRDPTRKGIRGLVLAPTRELAIQLTDALDSYVVGLKIRTVTLYGGAAYKPQLDALRRGVAIVIATPGRLLDHLKRKTLDLSKVEFVALDEADEMLRMGFIDDVTTILEATPETKQVALFSATMPNEIRRVAANYLRDPLEVQVEQRSGFAVDHIEQAYIAVPDGRKLDTLERVLRSKPAGATLIFARTRASCGEVADTLREDGFAAEALHGDLSQAAREQVLMGLRNQRLHIVVATDIAARGLDVDHLTHVINLDLPDEPESYVHRIGRVGRAGRKGIAISLVSRRDTRLLRRVEQGLKKKLDRIGVPSDAQIAAQQLNELEQSFKDALESSAAKDVAGLIDVLKKQGWSDKDLTAAAFAMVVRDRHLKIDANASDKPPKWATMTMSSSASRSRPSRQRPSRSARSDSGSGGNRPPHKGGGKRREEAGSTRSKRPGAVGKPKAQKSRSGKKKSG